LYIVIFVVQVYFFCRCGDGQNYYLLLHCHSHSWGGVVTLVAWFTFATLIVHSSHGNLSIIDTG
jgi:hypothetical protein